MALSTERCVACRRDSPRVTEEEKAELRPQVPEWVMTNADGIEKVEREYKLVLGTKLHSSLQRRSVNNYERAESLKATEPLMK